MQKKETRQPTAQIKKWLSTKELAKHSGYSLSYIYKLVWLNQIPCSTAPNGRKLIFDREQIDEWLTTNRRATIADIITQTKEVRHGK